MTDVKAIVSALRSGATARGPLVWEGYPSDPPAVAWPEPKDVNGYLDTAANVGARIMYVTVIQEDDEQLGVLAGFAVGGIVHTFAHGRPLEPGGLAIGGFGGFAIDADRDSWEQDEYDDLPAELQAVVDAVLSDQRYSGRWRSECLEVLSDHAGHLDATEFAIVKSAAGDRFHEVVGKGLETEAQRLAPLVLRAPDFDPLTVDDEFVAAAVSVSDPRALSLVLSTVRQMMWNNGQHAKADVELNIAATQTLTAMPWEVRDRLGFCTRLAQRLDLLSPFLDDIPQRRRKVFGIRIGNVEYEEYGLIRERRYATAARAMFANGETKAATARALGVSTSVLDRVMSTHPHDTELSADDPLHRAMPRPS